MLVLYPICLPKPVGEWIVGRLSCCLPWHLEHIDSQSVLGAVLHALLDHNETGSEKHIMVTDRVGKNSVACSDTFIDTDLEYAW